MIIDNNDKEKAQLKQFRMVLVIVASIAIPLCMVVILLGCLNCLQRKKPGFSNFNSASPTRENPLARNNEAFSVDMSDVDASPEQVVIEPLPDIAAKTADMPSLRPKMVCLERGKQEATLSLISIQRSFPRKDLLFLNEIGTGWFGKAIESEALRISGGSLKSQVVVKMLKDDASKVEQKQFLDEVNAFRCLEHANLMSLLGQCTEAAPYMVILESAPYGNLKTFLMENRHEADALVKKNQLISFTLDIASGVACLHRHDYIHNDLAARNCLVMGDHTVKIGDYGISDTLFKEDYFDTGRELLPIRWMAPESLIQTEGTWTSQVSDKTADTWSFGILMWEILSLGEQPYSMLTDVAVLQGVVLDRLLFPSEVDTRMPFKETLTAVMGQCWTEPTERPDIEQVCQSLGQMLRQRVDTMDTMNEFDQKWNYLLPNRSTRGSSGDSEAGSRIALAGSFATVNSSSPEESSAISDSAAVNTSQEAAFAGVEFEGHGITAASTPQPTAVQEPQIEKVVDNVGDSPALKGDLAGKDFNTSLLQDSVITENEVSQTREPADMFDASVNSPRDPQLLTTSTPKNQPSQNSTAQFYSAESSRNSAYMSALEVISPEPAVDKAPEQLTSIGGDLSLDSNGLSLSEFADKTLQESSPDASQNNSNITDLDELSMSKVIAAETAGREGTDQFGDFVQTSPKAPRPDFTDFEKALGGSEVVEGFEVIEKSDAAAVEAISQNDFTDFVASAGGENNQQNESADTLEQSSKDDDLADFVSFSSPGDKSADTVPAESLTSSTPHDALVNTSMDIDASSSLDSGLLASDLSTLAIDSMGLDIQSADPGSKGDEDIVPSNLKDLEELPSVPADTKPEIPQSSSNNNSLLVGFGEDEFQSGPDLSLQSNFSLISNPEEFLQLPVSPNKPTEVSAFSELMAPMSDGERFAPLDAEVPTVKEVLSEAQNDILPALNQSSSNDFSLLEFEGQPPPVTTDSGQPQDLLRIGEAGSEQVGTDSKYESTSHSTESESGINSRSVTDSLGQVAHGTQEHLNSSDSLGLVEATDSGEDSLISEGLSNDFRLSPPGSFGGSNLYRSSHIRLADISKNLGIKGQGEDSENIVRGKSPDQDESAGDSDSEVCSNSSDTSSTASGKEYDCEEDVFSDTGQPPTSPQAQTSTRLSSESGDNGAENALESSSYGDFDEQALRIASEIYLSKGVKSSRVYEIPPLETIPEHQPMPAISEDRIPTPSDSSSVEVKYDDLFSSDGYEWDDFFGDPLMGKEVEGNHSFQDQQLFRDSDVSDWSLDIDSESIHSSSSLQSRISEDSMLNQSAMSEQALETSTDSGKSLRCCSDSELIVPSSSSSLRARAISGKSLVSSILSQRSINSLTGSSQRQSTAGKGSNFYSFTEDFDTDTDTSSEGPQSPPGASLKAATLGEPSPNSSISLPSLPSMSSPSLSDSSFISHHPPSSSLLNSSLLPHLSPSSPHDSSTSSHHPLPFLALSSSSCSSSPSYEPINTMSEVHGDPGPDALLRPSMGPRDLCPEGKEVTAETIPPISPAMPSDLMGATSSDLMGATSSDLMGATSSDLMGDLLGLAAPMVQTASSDDNTLLVAGGEKSDEQPTTTESGVGSLIDF